MIEKSEKVRFEIKNGKIKAFYGHSLPEKIERKEKMPPDILYHGTARRYLEMIKLNGLLPQSRQYVHLSSDIETAMKVGKRHDAKPVILLINSKEAWKDGVKFYYGNDKVWLADGVASKYLKEI